MCPFPKNAFIRSELGRHMAAPEHITARIRSYILETVLPVVPAEIQLVSFEMVSWLVTIFHALGAASSTNHKYG